MSAEPLSGTFRGDLAALDAAAQRVEVWCGPQRGWLPLARRVSGTCVIVQVGSQLLAGPSYVVAEGAK